MPDPLPLARLEERGNETRRRRCGACLFELPVDVESIPEDTEFEEEFAPANPKDEKDWHETLSSTFLASVERNCDVCSSIYRLSKHRWNHSENLKWFPGTLRIPGYRWSLLFYSEGHSEALENESAFIHPYVRGGTFPSGDTASRQAFETATAWINMCREEHSDCSGSTSPPFPDRVLFIEDPPSCKVRLLDNAHALKPKPYICLSHRWGPYTRESSLTKDRLPLFCKAIPQHFFYPVLRDAIEIAARLGVEYLWIDCMTIIQDDKDDWDIQASRMASFYENAFLTVSAMSCTADAPTSRIFAKTLPTKTTVLGQREGRPIHMGGYRGDDHPFSPFSDMGNSRYLTKYMPKFPLASRGWCFQERILSRRVLHFTEDELMWECKEASWCECRFQEDKWKALKSTQSTLDREWPDIVEQYTETELSFERDRLPALSGIAQRYGEYHGLSYLAGLWLERPEELFWHTRTTKKARTPGYPSWSWASIPGEKNLRNPYRSDVEIVSYSIQLGLNPYGVPESAELVLDAYCFSGTILHSSGVVTAGVALQVGDKPLHVTEDFPFARLGRDQILSGTPALVLLSSNQHIDAPAILLVCTKSTEQHYERLGQVRIDLDNDPKRSLSLDDLQKVSERRRITLI